MLSAAVAGMLLGIGGFWVASSFSDLRVQDLGDPVRFDPSSVTVAPTPGPSPISTQGAQPEQVVPAAPSPAADDDAGDDTDDAGDTDDD